MNLKNKAELEKYFANHFDTILFPVLADIYKTEGDLNRAKKVCEIGLEYHPNNVEGLFILAEINQLGKNLTVAEELLKNVIAIEPFHYRATLNLAKIQLKLERTPDSIAKLWRKIAKINPTHPDAKAFLEQKSEPLEKKEISKLKKPDTKKSAVDKLKQKLETTPKTKDTPEETSQKLTEDTEKILGPKPPSIKPQKLSEEDLQSLDISPRMATFTMVNVLKKQKLYQQAMSVLKMLEEKGADSALINQERQNLQKLIKESQK